MKHDLLPEFKDQEKKDRAMMKDLDAFKRQHLQLLDVLEEVRTVNEFWILTPLTLAQKLDRVRNMQRGLRADERTENMIRVRSQNRGLLEEAMTLWKNLVELIQKEEAKVLTKAHATNMSSLKKESVPSGERTCWSSA